MQPRRSQDVETRILPDGYVVVFNKENRWAHTLTPLAAVMWEFCDGAHSLEQIVDEIHKLRDQLDEEHAHAIPEASDLHDAIKKTIDELSDQGLLIVDYAALLDR